MKYIFTLLSILSTSLYAQVVINEFTAANYDQTDFLSGAGTNYADWIELYNAGAASANIGGYYLSDNLTNPQKWQIPAGTTIAAGARLVFLADGDDTFANGYNHTDFKLTQTKGTEHIVFSNASGTVLESIALNYPNKKNESRARLTDGSANWGIQETPTPGAANNTNKERYCLKPTFSIAPGFYAATQTLTLSNTEPTSSIRYTTNGSEPTSSSTLYAGPITIAATTVIKAKTYSTNANIISSHTETNTYFINDYHTTKVISVSGGTQLASLFGGTQNEPQGWLELFETDGSFLTEATGEFNKHGNDSWAYSQRGVDFIARDQFGTNYALLDEIFDTKNRNEFQRVILKCGASDNYPFEGQANANYAGEYGGAHIRDAFINEMSQLGDLRLDERSNEFAVLYMNGSYWGVYDIREKVDDADFTDHYYNQGAKNIQYLKTWGGTWAEYGGTQATQDWDALVTFITTNDMTIPANYAYVDTVFNTGSLIDYFILNGFVVNADWLNWNTSWWRGLKPTGDKKKWRYTLWDMDATFNHYTNYSSVPSQNANSDPCNPDDLPDLGGQGHVPIWNALKENDNFFADYANRYAELSSTVFSCDSMHNLLNRMTAEIIGEMPAHIARWGGSMTEWQNNVDSLHAFIDTRCANVLTGLVNCDTALSGPYQLTLEVFPAGEGKIQMGSVTPANYPFTATYFGGVNINLSADPNQCWVLDYWTIANDTIFPNVNSNNINFDLSANDTVSVHYKQSNCIYIVVQPAGAGVVIIDGNTLSNYPNIESLTDSTNHTFDAVANTGYTFSNWDWGIHNPAPNSASTNTIVYTYTNDTVYANFTTFSSDTIVYITNPPLSGNITVNGTNINTFPSTSYYSSGTNAVLSATANAGYTFINWDFNINNPLPNSTSSNINVTWAGNDTCIINFTVVPVDTVVYLINPPGAGSITVGGTNISSFPSTQIYSQGSTSNVSATANAGFSFLNWDFTNNTALPNTNTNNISVTWTSNDTCTVNFNTVPSYNITYLVDPVGAGNINIAGVNNSIFPTTKTYLSGTNVSLNALNNPNFTFGYWETNATILNPSINASAVSFNATNNDTIIAHFDSFTTDTLWVVTNPVGVASLKVGTDIITTSPFMGIYEVGVILNLQAFPSGTNVFNQWNLNNVSLPDYNASTLFIFNGQDTLYAYFNNVLGIQDLGEDIANMKLYPTLVNNQITIEATANEDSQLSIDLFNLNGQRVSNLFNGTLKTNVPFVEKLNINVSEGVYFISINTEKTRATHKIVVIH